MLLSAWGGRLNTNHASSFYTCTLKKELCVPSRQTNRIVTVNWKYFVVLTTLVVDTIVTITRTAAPQPQALQWTLTFNLLARSPSSFFLFFNPFLGSLAHHASNLPFSAQPLTCSIKRFKHDGSWTANRPKRACLSHKRNKRQRRGTKIVGHHCADPSTEQLDG